MAKRTVTLIPGDGIGPEVTEAILPIIAASGADIIWERALAGHTALEKFGDPLPLVTIEAIQRNGVALKGPCDTPIGGGYQSVNVRMRMACELYANVRPARSTPGVRTRFDGVDLVIIRENTEDVYAGVEFASGTPHARSIIARAAKASNRALDVMSAVGLKIASPHGCRRIAEFAFRYARAHGRTRVTCVHKANIQKAADGLFLTMFREVAKEYPAITADDIIVDNCAHQLVRFPERFDVLCCPNLYGDILSDLCAGLVGGLGLAPGANIGPAYAVFEAVHGTAPDIAGKDRANPTAILRSAIMMLEHLGEREAATTIATALASVLKEGEWVTADLKPGSTVGTKRMAEEIRRRVMDRRRNDEVRASVTAELLAK